VAGSNWAGSEAHTTLTGAIVNDFCAMGAYWQPAKEAVKCRESNCRVCGAVMSREVLDGKVPIESEND